MSSCQTMISLHSDARGIRCRFSVVPPSHSGASSYRDLASYQELADVLDRLDIRGAGATAVLRDLQRDGVATLALVTPLSLDNTSYLRWPAAA
jgi:hypothetical protein